MPILDSEPWGHEFFERDGRYYLNAVCGTVGIYDVTVELTPDELEAFRRDGVSAIRSLAKSIRDNPPSVDDRRVRGVDPWS